MQNKTENANRSWPDELDALIADPEHHKLLFENEFVRVLDTSVPSGDQTNVHTHQNPASMYIISWSDFIRYDGNGSVMLDSRSLSKTPSNSEVLWSEPLIPHSVKNIGNEDLHVISVEVKIT